MPMFLRSDLIGFYNWTADGANNPKLQAEPDSSLLDRTDGHQILYMIRKIMEIERRTGVDAGQEIEMMIKVAPVHLQSQEEVMNWIASN
jgi:hypothetical protein